MKSHWQRLFLALMLAQAAHSVEEYVFRLYEVFPPARLLSGFISANHAVGFAIGNALLVSFGAWCYVALVRRNRPAGVLWAWFWTCLEAANGAMHLLIAASRGEYFPGAATAPLLLGFAAALAFGYLGYRLTILGLLVFFLGVVERKPILVVLLIAFGLSLGSHALFVHVLKVPLPTGPWGL